MAPRSVVELLSEQNPEALLAMLETARSEAKAAQEEVERKRAEVKLLEEALVKARRREGGGRLTREQVFDALVEPMTLDEVYQALVGQGVTATRDSVREHLRRLVEKSGTVLRDSEGIYYPQRREAPAATDDDIPF